MTTRSPPSKFHISRYKRLTNTQYFDNTTGEALYRPLKDQSHKSPSALRSSLIQLSRLIKLNFPDYTRGLHIVLTFDVPVLVPSALNTYFKPFWKKVSWKYTHLCYICIFEPHESGAWHIHLLLKSVISNSGIFIPYDELKKWWPHGKVFFKNIPRHHSLSVYFSKKEKLERVAFYPPRFQIYSHSKRGIVMPKPISMPYGDLLDIVAKKKYARAYHESKCVYLQTEFEDRPCRVYTYEKFEKQKG